MVLSDSWVRKTKAFAGLPEIDEKDRKMYFQLAGRVLLIFLFVGFVFSGQWSIWRILVAALGFVACVMVVVGFKAKFSATMLVVILSIFNLLVNNFWTVRKVLLSVLVPSLTCFSSTNRTLTRTSQNTTSSRSSPLLVVSFYWSTAGLESTVSTRRRRSTRARWRVSEVRKHELDRRLKTNSIMRSYISARNIWAYLGANRQVIHSVTEKKQLPTLLYCIMIL